MNRRVALALAALVALSVAGAAESPAAPAQAAALDHELDTIRDQLVALDIEQALFALNAIVERPDLSEAGLIAALDLRAQAHAAGDNLDGAESDYRALLKLRPAYAPNTEVTPKKAMERFVKLKATMIGTVRVDLDPKDAALTVDGRPVPVTADGVFQVVAGERRLRFARRGFDAGDVDVRAVAGQETPVRVRLVPNARSLVARTDVDGVAVTLDGVAVGVATRGADTASDANALAALLIEDVAIGDHAIGFAKPCFATEILAESVSVDLADRTPKLLRVVAMRPSRTRVTSTGAQYAGELRVDGEPAASLPLTSFTICPGQRKLDVVASGRVVWSGLLSAEESDITLDLRPRPGAALVGSAWPAAWIPASASWSPLCRLEPPVGADLKAPEGWDAVALPPGTDLAVAVLPGAGVAGEQRVVLYGTALREVEDRASPPSPFPPSWTAPSLGAVLVDAGQGVVVFASVSPAGPAARAGLLPGDRLIAIAGRSVATAASAREAIGALGAGATPVLDVAPPSGAMRRIPCETVTEPLLANRFGDDGSRVVRAAWAAVDAAAGGPDAAPALANLAGLLEGSGKAEGALEAWRRVRAIGGGALAARAAYAIGAGLEASGKRSEAIEAFGRSRAESIANADLALAAASGDRLADLGVAPR